MKLVSPESDGIWGIMGGAFDPVHYGHLKLAEQAFKSFDLAGILFVVSYNPPHREKPIASFEDRFSMVKMAIKNNDNYAMSDIEKIIDGPCYTLTLVETLKKHYPKIDWYLILGADNIGIFDSWYKPNQLAEAVKIAVGNRPGFESTLHNSHWSDKVLFFEMTPTDISSTMIRSRIAEKQSISEFLPQNVEQYVLEKGLYV